MKYWEIIADRLSWFGSSWGMTTVQDTNAGKVFVADAHRTDLPGRFIVRSDDLLTAFMSLDTQLTNALAEHYRDAA